MKTTEVTADLVGKRCKSIFTGLMITGTIEDIRITEHTAEVKVRFDEPQNWGGKWFKCDWSHGRLCDEFGPLQYLEIIDEGYKTICVTFSQEIGTIDRMFSYEYKRWGAVNLKEWIDSYDTSRFTRIAPDRAIITSQINMENIIEWLERNTPIVTIKPLI